MTTANLNFLVGLSLAINQSPQLSTLREHDFDGFTGITGLDIAGTSVKSLPPGTFKDLGNVERLNLFDNRLKTLESGILTPLTSLTNLNLSDNPLKSISSNAFGGLSSLDTLTMSHTELTTLPPGLFDGLTAVRFLRLVGVPLTSLPPRIFDSLIKLLQLYLQGTELTELPDDLFAANTEVERVFLDHNKLTKLPRLLFPENPDETPLLREVQLGNNLLTEIPSELSAGISGLWETGLNDNRLEELHEGSFDENPNIEILDIQGNMPGLEPYDFAHLKSLKNNGLKLTDNEVEEEPGSTTRPTAASKVLRIEPNVRALTLNSGDKVWLYVDVYDPQDLLDNTLADADAAGNRPRFSWSDDDGGGSFAAATGNPGADYREVVYTTPDRPGTYKVTVNVPFSEGCLQKRDDEDETDALARCTAVFEVRVRRPSAIGPRIFPPDPILIPPILTDSDGVAYEVLTPQDGGTYVNEDFNFAAPSGAVANGEYIGVRMQRGESASNVGQTHHRYTLDGDWHTIGIVDGSGDPISS